MNKVSVIIPTYGRPENLRGAISSVLVQSYTNWELIVVDDNNPNTEYRNQTQQIMDDFSDDNRIKYIKHEKNKNGAAARNTGLSYATGDYIAFLDDDDIFSPNRIKKCIEKLEKEPARIGGVYTGCSFFRNGRKYRNCSKAPDGNFLVETLATSFNSYSGSNFVFKKVVFNVIGGFDESFIRHQDYEFLVRFFLHFDLVGINECLLVKNELGTNIPNFDKIYATKLKYLEKYKEILEACSEKEVKYIKYSHYYQLSNIAYGIDKKLGNEMYHIAVQFEKPSLIDYIRHIYIRLLSKNG